MKNYKTTTEDLERAARLADAMYELNEKTGVISVGGIGRPSVLLRPESWKEAFSERPEAVIEDKGDTRFYSYDDGHILWGTNEQIKEVKNAEAI